MPPYGLNQSAARYAHPTSALGSWGQQKSDHGSLFLRFGLG